MQRKNPVFTFAQRKNPKVKINLHEQLEKYLEVKRIEKRAVKTVQAYKQTLSQFGKWYEESEHDEITTDVLREYILYLTEEKRKWDDHPTSPTQGQGLSARSINNVIRNIRVFFNYLVRERVISSSPADALSYQTEEKETFSVFTDEDVEKLLQAPNLRVYTGFRDYCMMLILLDTGVRIKELTSLRISDINFRLRQIVIRSEIAKTNTTRIVPISSLTARELERLIAMMNTEYDDPLWLTQFGERYYGDTFAKNLKIYARRVGVKTARVSPHTFRHYFAVKFLRGGGDPIALQRILGHTSMNMTQVYVRYTGSNLQEQHDKASPVMAVLDNGNSKKRGPRRFK